MKTLYTGNLIVIFCKGMGWPSYSADSFINISNGKCQCVISWIKRKRCQHVQLLLLKYYVNIKLFITWKCEIDSKYVKQFLSQCCKNNFVILSTEKCLFSVTSMLSPLIQLLLSDFLSIGWLRLNLKFKCSQLNMFWAG